MTDMPLVREDTKPSRKTSEATATKHRRLVLHKPLKTVPAKPPKQRNPSVADIIRLHKIRYELDHRGDRPSIRSLQERLAPVERLLGPIAFPNLTEAAIRAYITIRKEERTSGNAINAEVSELSRAIGKSWSRLWPKVRRQPDE